MSWATSDPKKLMELDNLTTLREKNEYFANGYVTVAKLGQVIEKKIVTRYVAKIRGIVIGSVKEKCVFDTPEEAREYGIARRDHHRKVYQTLDK